MPSSISIQLNFSTLYMSSIKPYTKISQKNIINSLLATESDNGVEQTLDDTACSNYAWGKKDLTNDLRIYLLKLSKDTLEERIKDTGVSDYDSIAETLDMLVQNATNLKPKQKKDLAKSYKNNESLAFIVEVFSLCVKIDNTPKITTDQANELKALGASIKRTNSEKKNLVDDDDEYDDDNEESEEQDDDTWMEEYLPKNCEKNNGFVLTPLEIRNYNLAFPTDYRYTIQQLSPIVLDSPYIKFTIPAFIKAMDLDKSDGSASRGNIQYWEIEGNIKDISEFIDNLNFANVSDIAFILMGKFESEDVEAIERRLIDISNPKVNLLKTIVNTKDMEHEKMRLFTHICEEKVSETQLNNGNDNTHLFIPSSQKRKKNAPKQQQLIQNKDDDRQDYEEHAQ